MRKKRSAWVACYMRFWIFMNTIEITALIIFYFLILLLNLEQDYEAKGEQWLYKVRPMFLRKFLCFLFKINSSFAKGIIKLCSFSITVFFNKGFSLFVGYCFWIYIERINLKTLRNISQNLSIIDYKLDKHITALLLSRRPKQQCQIC